MRHSEKVCLIIPCYNEEHRLDIEAFTSMKSENLIFVFVNDGSTDDTGKILDAAKSEYIHTLHLEKNCGKAEAVRQAALFVKENISDEAYDWIGFWDSDLSVPLSELSNFFAFAALFAPDADAIIGSRVKRMGSSIVRSAQRHYLGRCFCTVVSFLFSADYYDSQCGAKLFRSHLLEPLFQEEFSANWIFDVELLLRLRGSKVIEYPLSVWREVGGSKIQLGKVFGEVVRDLYRLKRLYKNS